jgi:hypothetical protein
LVSSCENKNAGTSINDSVPVAMPEPTKKTNNKTTVVAEKDELKDSIPVVKIPCIKGEKTAKNYKNDDAGVSIEVESSCSGDYSILDTIEDFNGNLKITAHSSYEHRVSFTLKGHKKQYIITRQLFADSIARHHFTNYILVKPEIMEFTSVDTSTTIRVLFGPPDTDDVIYTNFKVNYNNGVQFIGFAVPEYE